jgi:hypothetical protein
MTGIGSYALITSSAGQRWSRSVHTVEKIRPRAHSDGEYEEHREPKSWICVPYGRREACQAGTDEDGSFRDSRVLTSEFAAQVIGQATFTNTPSASAQTAYRKSCFVLLPQFDKNV